MFNWLRKIFKKELAVNYHVVISNENAKELEYYYEPLYYFNKNKMEFRKWLFPSIVKKGLIFLSDSGIPFEITKVAADGKTINAKRV